MKTRKSLALFAPFLLGLTTAAIAEDFVARGNEPGWVVRKTEREITFQSMGGPSLTVSPVPAAKTVENGESYETTLNDQPFRLTINDRVCVDTMSGMNFPASVEVQIGTDMFSGCGGEPFSLLRGEWTVEEIPGRQIVEGSLITLNFEDNGQVNGSASCNRYFASFTLTGESLTFSKPGASMMMCEEALMDQERGFLDALAAVNHFTVAPDGQLTLLADDTPAMIARQKKLEEAP